MTPVRVLGSAAVLAIAGLLLVVGARPVAAQDTSLAAGDIVRVTLSRMPDMSGDFPVDESGEVGLPMVGVVNVVGRPSDAVKRDIVARFEEQVRNQTIQVVFLRRVSVLGAVQNPGLYHVEPTMTLADAVALAGGHTNQGNPEKVRIVKDGRETEVDITESTGLDLASGDRIIVPERSWMARNSNMLIGAAISAAVVFSRFID